MPKQKPTEVYMDMTPRLANKLLGHIVLQQTIYPTRNSNYTARIWTCMYVV